MAIEYRKINFFKVYTGEDVMYNDIPLYKAVLREARRLGLAGATVTKGIEGFASNIRGMGRAINTFVSGNANYPIIIEICDKMENIEKLLPFLEKNATHALVLVEESNYVVTDYMRRKGLVDLPSQSKFPEDVI